MTRAEVLDCRHLMCPMPVIRTQARMAGLAAGDELEVAVTDLGALEDIPAWCRVHGHEVLAIDETEGGGEHRIRIRVGGD
ncbi:MAG: sulfurtransferase TusA family protein [Halorhodospira sp.]